MDALLPQTYLIGLIVLLGVAAVVVGRQLWRVRADEVTLAKLEQKDGNQPSDAATLYELGSLQLRKRLYGQAAESLKQALKKAEAAKEPWPPKTTTRAPSATTAWRSPPNRPTRLPSTTWPTPSRSN